jgi:hypothetical protein
MTWRCKRYRVPVNEYAIPRMEPGKQRPIQSMEEARDWERRFIGEVKAGLDPQRPPSPPKPNAKAEIETVSAFLDAYFERCAKPAGLRSLATVESRLRRLKEQLGHLPLDALEDPDEINRFKAWGLAQTPPLFTKSPFHRFGVRMNKKAETVRDRRVSREEERRRLDTALQKMNDGVSHVRRGAPARPHYRRAGAVLQAWRDAVDPEQAGELGHTPDRHPRCHR